MIVRNELIAFLSSLTVLFSFNMRSTIDDRKGFRFQKEKEDIRSSTKEKKRENMCSIVFLFLNFWKRNRNSLSFDLLFHNIFSFINQLQLIEEKMERE